MPSTQDYTLIQFMRGGKYAVETTVPKDGEPVLDIDSGTLYVGDNKTARGIPLNTVTSLKLESPVNLNDQVTWGRYYLEGKVSDLPDGVELYGKFFLTVQGNTATDATSIWQKLDVLTGDFSDQSFVRSSINGGQSWTAWKGSNGGLLFFDQSGFGSVDKNPTGELADYTLPSQNYIDNIVGGPEDSDGHSGFLFVYRKDLISPFVFQQLMILDAPNSAGKVFCRFSSNENRDWNSPGYTWREITAITASKTERGTVKIGDNINIDEDVISVNNGSKTKKGVVQVGTNINVDKNGLISIPTASGSERGVVQTGTNINNTNGVISVSDGNIQQKGVVKLSSSLTSQSEETAATSKAINDLTKIRSVMVAPTKPSVVPPELAEEGILIVKNDDGVTPSQVYPSATGASKGIVQVGNNLNINDGILSVDNGTTSQKGVVQLSSSTNNNSEALAATTKAVKSAYDLAAKADAKKYVVYATSTPSRVPDGLVEGGIVIVA